MTNTIASREVFAASNPVSDQATKWITWLWIGLALVPPAFLLVVLLNHTLRVPFQDEFLFLPLVFKLHTGGLTLADLWNQHNEHRIIVWRIIALGLARLGGYSVIKETLCGYGFALLTLIPTWRLLGRTVPQIWRGPALVGCSIMIFSLGQWENWLWGFQPPWFLVNLLVLLAVVMLSYRPVRPRNFVIAVGLAVAATYTVGSGLMVWPAISLAMLLYWKQWRWKYFTLWIIAAIASYGLYLSNYKFYSMSGVQPLNYTLQHPWQTITFILNCLGLPMAYWSATTQACMWFGLSLLLAVGISAGWLAWQAWRSHYVEGWLTIWPWLTIVLFAVGNAFLEGVNRVGLGMEGSLMASRYATIMIWFWIGGGIIIGIAAKRFWQLNKVKIKNWWVGWALVGLVGLGLVVSFGFTSVNAYRDWLVRENYINPFEPFLYEYQTAPDYALSHLFIGHPEMVRAAANLLEQYHEGSFSITKQQFQENETRQWREGIKPAQQPVVYPANLAYLAFGEISNRNITGQYLEFTHTGKQVVETVYNLKDFYHQQGLDNNISKVIPGEIDTQNAYYVQVYFDQGGGFRPDQVISLAVTEETNNHRYFRLNLPTNTQRIQVETSYRVSRALPEELKLTLYLEH